MGDAVRVEPVPGVEHHCNTPRGFRFSQTWRCPICRRIWDFEGRGTWHTDCEGGWVVGFTMAYPDGTTAMFGGGDDLHPRAENARLRAALQRIADEDYRGNRPSSAVIAQAALSSPTGEQAGQ